MNPALWISKTGLEAQQTNIATISNNLANASTVGFKKERAIFEDLLYQAVNQPGGQSSQNTKLPSGLLVGSGTRVVATQKDHSQGNMLTTDNSLDLMVSGRGYFEIEMPDGTTSYTRNGQFTLNDEGMIVTPGSGYPLLPQTQVPAEAQTITVSEDGEVSVSLPGQTNNQAVGQLNVADFVNPAGLQPVGQNLFIQTSASGDPIEGVPGSQGLGKIVQGAIETSNVNVTEELVNLIESQRVYEMNSKVISTVDEMLSYTNQNL